MTAGSDLSGLWVPLLRRLTELSPAWGIWKNVDSAFHGSGDVDSASPGRDWPALVDAFRTHMFEHSFGPVIVCPHPPRVLFLLAVDRARGTFHELDLLGRKYFRGATMWRAEDLVPLYEMDARGFRRVRPGAEGLILLVQNGTRWGGRPNAAGLAKRPIAELLAKDPDGALEAARAFRFPAGAVADATRAVIAGGWDAGAMRRIEASAIVRAPAEPSILARRIAFKTVTRKRCPVIDAIFTKDRRPGDLDAWLARVRRTHAVYDRAG